MNETNKRLNFIDAARSLAIILMLQGHFISLTFQEYTEMAHSANHGGSGNIFFDLWFILRGFTAPLFFTITGVVFTFLLLREREKPFWQQVRVRKGFKRGAQIILLGYLLQLNYKNLDYYLRGHINSSFFTFHVLPSIGISLFLLIGLYALSRVSKKIPLYAIMLVAATVVFTLTPVIKSLGENYFPPNAPQIIQNMIHGPRSAFPIFPWFGYVLLGGFVGAFIQEYKSMLHEKWTPLILAAKAIVGCFIILVAVRVLHWWIEPEMNFMLIGRYFRYFAIVLMVLVAMLYLERTNKIRIPFLLEMGKNTLNIYIVHALLLYGAFIGIGIKTFYNKSLTFPQAVLGALLFILFFGVMTLLQNKIKKWWKDRKAKLKTDPS